MKKAIFSVSFFNFFSAGLAFILNIFLARNFSVEVYGRINLLLSFTLIINTLIDLGFTNTNVIFNNKFKKEYANTTLVFFNKFYFKKIPLILFISFSIILLISVFYKLAWIEVLFLIGQGTLVGFFRFFLSYHQSVGDWFKFNLINVSLNIFKILGVFSVFLFLLVQGYPIKLSYEVILLVIIISSLLVFIISLYYATPYLKDNKNILINENDSTLLNEEIKKILYPLIGINITIILAMRLDTILIDNFIGERELGLYSAANSLALVFPLITNSMIQVLLKESAEKGPNYLRNILSFQKKHSGLVIFLIVIVEILSYFIIPLIYGEEYREGILYFQILILAYIGGIIFTPLETYFYSKKTKFILFIKIMQLLIILTVSLLGIILLNIGTLAIVLSILLSRILGWVLLYHFTYKELKYSTCL